MFPRFRTQQAVVLIGINLHLEVFPGFHQRCRIVHCVLKMHIIVRCPVHKQQISLQITGQMHR